MSPLPKVAVAGAGNLGIPIINALLQSKQYSVTVLSRSPDAATKYSDSIPSDPNVSFAAVDYDSLSSLTEALQGHFAVVSTLTTSSVASQKTLIDAAVAAKVTRFIPSEFGSDTTNPNSAKLPVYGAKLGVEKILTNVAKENPQFSYTLIINGPFFDWGLAAGFFIDTKKRTATIYDGGDCPFSTTTLATIGKAVVAVFNNLDATKNRIIKIHDTVITQNKIIEITKKLNGKSWSLEENTTDASREAAYAKLASGKPEDIGPAMISFLFSAVFGGDEYGADFSKTGTDNELLGIPEFTEEQVEEVVSRYV